ncbi:MAG: ABC transporter permease subunit [Parvibaculaceae bacterium]
MLAEQTDRVRPAPGSAGRFGFLSSKVELLGFCLLVLLAIALVWPIAKLLIASLSSSQDLAAYYKMATSALYQRALVNTFVIAGLVMVCCLLAAYPLAYVMASVSPVTASLLTFIVLLPFWTSALVRTAAWMIILQRNGIANTILLSTGLVDEPITFLYNLSGVIIGMSHVLLPFMVMPLYAAFRAMDGQLLQAAAGLGARPGVLVRRIVLPLTAPGAAAGSLIVFMSAIGYYITPSLMGGPRQTMLAQMISYHMQTRLDWAMASALSVVLLASTLAVFFVFQRFYGFDRLFTSDSGGTIDPSVARMGGGYAWRGATVAAVIVAIFLIAPVLLVFPLSFSSSPFIQFPPAEWTTRWYARLAEDPKWLYAFWSSARVAILAVALAIVFGTAAAILVSRLKGLLRGVLEILLIAPLVIPPIIIAVALYYQFATSPLMGSHELLAFGHALLAMPFVYITVRASLRSFDPNLELAAMGLGASWWTTFRRIIFPALVPGIAAGGVFAFITSFDDVVLALFLTNAHSRTLPRVIYEGARDDIDPAIISVSALLILTSLVALAVSIALRIRK